MAFNEGDKVKIPHKQEGIIVEKNERILWGYKYRVKVTSPTINNMDEVIECKEEQLTLI